MWVVREAIPRTRNAHEGQELRGPLTGHGVAHPQVLPEPLGELVAHAQHGVERRGRILEHHGDVPTPHAPQLGRGKREQVAALEEGEAALDSAGRVHEAEDGERAHGLPRPALSHDAERLALVQGVGDATHGPHHALVGVEAGDQVPHLEKVSHRRPVYT